MDVKGPTPHLALSKEGEELLARLLVKQGFGVSQKNTIAPREKTGRPPLSFAQQRLWFLDQLEPNNPFYNIGRALRLHGPLDVNALTQAINHIIRRHESLRTSFGELDGTPFQRIMIHASQPIPVVDLTEA